MEIPSYLRNLQLELFPQSQYLNLHCKCKVRIVISTTELHLAELGCVAGLGPSVVAGAGSSTTGEAPVASTAPVHSKCSQN